MSIELTPDEREKKIIDNMNLVYHMLKQLTYINPNNYEDLVQIGRIGLIKAVSTFDDTKGIKFATYASRCINNEIYMSFRKERFHNSDISLNDTIHTEEEGSELELEDILGDEDDFVDEIANEEIIINALDIILNVLNPKEAIAMLHRISGIYTQKEIGKSIGVSQAQVSKLKKRATQNIRKYLERKEKLCTPIFSMAKVGSCYQLSCNTRQLNECLAKFLQDSKTTILPNYKVTENNGRIELTMPSYPETFVFIAEFLKEIYGL